MLMMMMMMKKKGSKSLAVVAFFLASASCLLPPSKDDLNKISLMGEKYVDAQVENAISGVKEMKSVMQKSSEDRKKFLDQLEKTRQQKEEAIRSAQEMEVKLEQQEDVCNETMKQLWDECKPCLKKTCVKFFSRTCSSGSGLVGRQLEDILNRTSPFSIWINGENINVLEQEGKRQNQEFKNLDEKFSMMAGGVDDIFSNSMKVADHAHFKPPSFFLPPFMSSQGQPSRVIRSLFRNPFEGFQSLFSPMMDASRNIFDSMGSMMDFDMDMPANEDGDVNEDVVVTKPFGDGRMTCREIRRNSAGCLKFRDECQKCKEIEHLDCSGTRPLEGPLKEQLEQTLAAAERFTQQYNRLLRNFEEQMFNTSSILDLFNSQFGWVSTLANSTNSNVFRVHTLNSRDTEKSGDPAETNVSVQLFDSPSMNFTVPGDIPWTDPKFSEVVAQRALDQYKETSVVAK